MSQKARAAVLEEFRQPLRIREYPIERTPAGFLVRVTTAGICGTDVHLWRGELPINLPVVLGHETAGILEEIGSSAPARDWRGEPLRVGDRVTWASSISCGTCFYCLEKSMPTRCAARKAYGISYRADTPPFLRGGYAERIGLRPETALFKLPEEVTDDALIGAGCGLTTAIHGLERAPIKAGDTVVVQGTGPVGIAAIALCAERDAGRVIAVGGPPHRLERARNFGAAHTLDIGDLPSPADRRTAVLELTGSYGADFVIECVGQPQALNESIGFARDGATVLVLGQYGNGGDIPFNPHSITRKQLRLVGSWGFEPRHVDSALKLLSGSWGAKFASAVTHRFPLDGANEALGNVRDCAGGKTVIQP